MLNIKQIYEGWRNNLIPPSKLKGVIEKTASERMAICSSCELHSENAKKHRGYKSLRPDEHCTNCGCTLSAKTKCLSCECPLKKWEAVLTEEQQEQIDKIWKTKTDK